MSKKSQINEYSDFCQTRFLHIISEFYLSMSASKVCDGNPNIHGGIEADKIDTGTSSCIRDVSQRSIL